MNTPSARAARPSAAAGFAAALAVAALLATGCSPRLDWRGVRPQGTGLEVQMPCRPSIHARKVTLAGQPREMNLLTCSAADAIWALAWVQDVEPARLADLAGEWRSLALANLDAAATAGQPLTVPGSTPNLQAGRWRSTGRRPDGSVVRQDLAVFSRGTTVYQATVLASQPEDAAVEHFFGALRFPA
jgi:hypothetical protein